MGSGKFAAVFVGAGEVEVVFHDDGDADIDAACLSEVECAENDVGEFFFFAGEVEVVFAAGLGQLVVACGFPELGDFAVDVGGPDGEVFDGGAIGVGIVEAVVFGAVVGEFGKAVKVIDERGGVFDG